MKNSDSVRKLWKLFSSQQWDESKLLFHEHFEAYWPQSKEKFVGVNNFVEMNRAYPGNHTAKIQHLLEGDDMVVCTAFISADTDQTAFATSYFKFSEGLIISATEYWSEEYAAPESRKQWTSL